MNQNPSHFEILHASSAGYVARCACCEDIQVGIGNLVCHMSQESFDGFFRALRRIGSSVDEHLAQAPDGERILIETPVPNMMLSFSLVEYCATMELFAQASMMLEIKELLEVPNGKP